MNNSDLKLAMVRDISDAQLKDIKTLVEMTGHNIDDIAGEFSKKLDQILAPYRNDDGEIRPMKAIWHDGPKTKDCYFLDDTTIFRAPYAKIFCDGQTYSVPREKVQIIEGAED